jgi:hypothetical protein
VVDDRGDELAVLFLSDSSSMPMLVIGLELTAGVCRRRST